MYGAPDDHAETSRPAQTRIPFGEALRVWAKVALLSFGGPAGQIAVMHRILVEDKRWVSEQRFLHALNYCMFLPGPEAMQLATYIGWLLHRAKGGLVAGGLFVLPGFIAILVLSVLYAGFQGTAVVAALFYGLKPAVMAVVLEAVIRIGRRALKNAAMVTLAAAAFIAIFFLRLPFPLIIVGAAAVGFVGGRLRPDWFYVFRGHDAQAQQGNPEPGPYPGEQIPATAGRALRVTCTWLALWWGPVLALMAVLGSAHVFVQEGVFFSTAAVVTFGGAYAVLAYIAQQAVAHYGWLQPGEMLDGLGMAETTPGPLIQVVQFVGFMGAYRHPGALDPMLAGVLGSLLTTWVTFAPCFLWIFLGAPYIERLRDNRALSTALSGITAAVVGVILNLALWFSIHTLFAEVAEHDWRGIRLLAPYWSTLDPVATAIAAAAFIALFRLKWGMLTTLASGLVTGALYYVLTLAE